MKPKKPDAGADTKQEAVKSAVEIAQERAEELLNRQDGEEEPAETPRQAAESAQTTEMKAQLAEYIDHLQRLQAEFDNYRKRVEREKAEFVKFAAANVIEPLTEVLDDFERGLQDDHIQNVPESFLRGMQGVHRKLRETLERSGLQRVPTVGEPFDPEIHEAAMRETTDAFPPGIISGEIRPGYRLGERLLRAPLVKVAAAPSQNE